MKTFINYCRSLYFKIGAPWIIRFNHLKRFINNRNTRKIRKLLIIKKNQQRKNINNSFIRTMCIIKLEIILSAFTPLKKKSIMRLCFFQSVRFDLYAPQNSIRKTGQDSHSHQHRFCALGRQKMFLFKCFASFKSLQTVRMPDKPRTSNRECSVIQKYFR